MTKYIIFLCFSRKKYRLALEEELNFSAYWLRLNAVNLRKLFFKYSRFNLIHSCVLSGNSKENLQQNLLSRAVGIEDVSPSLICPSEYLPFTKRFFLSKHAKLKRYQIEQVEEILRRGGLL